MNYLKLHHYFVLETDMNQINLDDSYIIKEYINGRSTTDISNEFNCSRTTIERRLKKHDIKLKPGGGSHLDSGKKRHSLYITWFNMKQRCYNSKNNVYKYYGNRGILICDEWKDSYESFKNWSLKNGWKQGLTIDRIDVNGNYEPSNCRWSTRQIQANNTTRNKYLTYNNQTKTVTEWEQELGTSKDFLAKRLRKGWSVDKIFETPSQRKI